METIKNQTVPIVRGDGVGPEVTASMMQVLDAAVEKAYAGSRSIRWMEVPAGGTAYERFGTYLPEETIAAFRQYHIGIKGPLMTPVGGGIRSLNVALRQGLDLYVCLRPVRWFKGVASPVKHPEKVDMVVFRENTEDIYSGIEWESGSPEAARFYDFLSKEMGVKKVRFPETSAFGVKPVSKEGTERLVRAACRYALDHGRKTVTLVHKGNIMKFTEGGFKKWGYELAEREFGEEIASGRLAVNDCICDAFLQNALLYPERYSGDHEPERGLHLRHACRPGRRHRHGAGGEHQLHHGGRHIRGYPRDCSGHRWERHRQSLLEHPLGSDAP